MKFNFFFYLIPENYEKQKNTDQILTEDSKSVVNKKA